MSKKEARPRDAGTWPEDEGETKTRQGTGDNGPHHAGQKTVQGKNERGPRTDEAKGEEGNEGSRGQNIDPRRQKDEHTGKKYTH